MGLLPESATFEELVADCFAAFRGSGVMISPLDAELVTDWADRQIPFEVVARGMRKAAEKALWDARPGEPALRSLRACRREIEAEIKKYTRLSAGRSAGGEEAASAPARADPDKAWAATLRKLGRAQPVLAPLCDRLIDEVRSGAAPEPGVREQRLSAQLLRALPFEQRVRLLREARALAAGQALLSAHGRKLSRRFHQGAVLRRALDLAAFW